MMAVWAEAVPVTRAERAESTFFAWEAIMEAARTFEEDVEEAARTFEAEQATTIEVSRRSYHLSLLRLRT